ncbi:MAG: TetR family transcriptional regulator [Actinomycetales bacterium]|nr:TetR family transcriptional regulator [Actinomycetales bacterium]
MTSLIRNEPVQARSAARLTALLDAAAQVVHEIGYERLTTAMVADRAGASIGTVYRYFPDRIAVLQSLAARNAERLTERIAQTVADSSLDGWKAVGEAVFDVAVEAYRTEPGYAALRFGDVLDLRPRAGSPANAVLAGRLFDALTSRFGLDDSAEARLAFEAASELCDALVARAFWSDPQGDPRFLEQARRAAFALVGPYFER